MRPGPVAILSTGTSRRPFGPATTQVARGDQRRHAIGRRRRVAEITGKRRPTLHLGRADQIGGLDHPGPGPPQGFAFADHSAGRRRADDKAAVPLANAGDAGDLFDINDQPRLGPAGAELNQQIGPAGQDLRGAGGSGQNTYGLLDRRRGGIIEHDLGVSKLTERDASPALVGGPGRSAIRDGRKRMARKVWTGQA